MSIPGIVIDAVIIAVCIIIVLINRKRGAVKSLMSLLSGIASLLIAYVFTPALSAFLKEKLFLDKLAQSIMDTVASLAQSGKDAAANVMYDVSGLMKDSQFLSVLERFRADPETTGKAIAGIGDSTHAAVEKVSYAVAEPISKAISDVVAFALIFIVSLIILKILTAIISAAFKLPVLKTLDKAAGTVIGIIAALFFVLVFAMIVNDLSDLIVGAAPSSFPNDIASQSLILRFLSKFNVISFLTEHIAF